MIVYDGMFIRPEPAGSGSTQGFCGVMEYTQVNIAFRHLGIVQETAECHGLLCGLICARRSVSQEDWVAHLYEEGSAPPQPSEDASPHEQGGDVLQQLYRNTMAQIRDAEFSFRLLLPDDEQILAARTQALADWCKGFLYGLGVGGLDSEQQVPDNVEEIVRDLIEISRVYHDDEEADEEVDEASFMELSEYVRVGVMLIYEELQAEREQNDDNKVLH